MLRAIVIDDEQSGIVTLELLAKKFPQTLRIVASAMNAEKGIQDIEDYLPDVVFLDISMPHLNGFELLDRLTHKNFKLVFVTAHREYAIQAIKNRAFDYLLKPIDTNDFLNCLQNLLKETKTETFSSDRQRNVPLIELSVRDGIIYVRQDEIVRVEASGSYTIFYLENKVRHTVSKSMKDYQQLLNPHDFFRCHHSHIVNLNKVSKFIHTDGLFIQMTDGSRALVSRRYKDLFLERIKQYV